MEILCNSKMKWNNKKKRCKVRHITAQKTAYLISFLTVCFERLKHLIILFSCIQELKDLAINKTDK